MSIFEKMSEGCEASLFVVFLAACGVAGHQTHQYVTGDVGPYPYEDYIKAEAWHAGNVCKTEYLRSVGLEDGRPASSSPELQSCLERNFNVVSEDQYDGHNPPADHCGYSPEERRDAESIGAGLASIGAVLSVGALYYFGKLASLRPRDDYAHFRRY